MPGRSLRISFRRFLTPFLCPLALAAFLNAHSSEAGWWPRWLGGSGGASTGENVAAGTGDANCDDGPMLVRVRPRKIEIDDPRRVDHAAKLQSIFMGKCINTKSAQDLKKAGEELSLVDVLEVGTTLLDNVNAKSRLGVYLPWMGTYYDSMKSRLEGSSLPVLVDGHLHKSSGGEGQGEAAEGVSLEQFRAIDGVARTIWGEVGTCPEQMEAIGRVIVDRVLSGKKRYEPEKCKSDGMLPAERVVACDRQFSNWDAPENPNGLEDTLRDRNRAVLCPKEDWETLPTARRQAKEANWTHAVELAKQIVLKPEAYRSAHRWPGEENGQTRSVETFTHLAESGLKTWRQSYYELSDVRSISDKSGRHGFETDTGPGCKDFKLWREKPAEVREAEAESRREAAAAEAKRKSAEAKRQLASKKPASKSASSSRKHYASGE